MDEQREVIQMHFPEEHTPDDGRRLRRYERRWIVERVLAWIQW